MKLLDKILSIVKPNGEYKNIAIKTLNANEQNIIRLRKACEKPKVMANGAK